MNSELGPRIELVGDDLFCTDPTLIARGIEEDMANAVLTKLHQISTLAETIAAGPMPQRADMKRNKTYLNREIAIKTLFC